MGVVLTKGSLVSQSQLWQIVAALETAEDSGNLSVVPVSTPSFEFPDARYFEDELPKRWPGDVAQAGSLIQKFFKKVAVVFPTKSSDVALDTSVGMITGKLPTHH